MDQSKATVSITDYGFNYGAGVYEVTRVEQGKVYQLDEHINRFYSSCEKIGLSLKQNKDEIKRVSFELVNLNKEQNAIIYYQATFGAYDHRSHIFPAALSPTVVIFTQPLKPYPESVFTKGMKVATAEDVRWHRCDIKSICLLPNVMALNKVIKEGYDDVLFLQKRDDGQQIVTEMSASNIFVVKDGIIYSPPDSGKILNGITRATLFQLADSHNMKYEKTHFNIEFLLSADEVFVTSTTKEVVPIYQVDQKVFKSVPGPITIKLMKLFVDHVEKELNIKYPKRELLSRHFSNLDSK